MSPTLGQDGVEAILTARAKVWPHYGIYSSSGRARQHPGHVCGPGIYTPCWRSWLLLAHLWGEGGFSAQS